MLPPQDTLFICLLEKGALFPARRSEEHGQEAKAKADASRWSSKGWGRHCRTSTPRRHLWKGEMARQRVILRMGSVCELFVTSQELSCRI